MEQSRWMEVGGIYSLRRRSLEARSFLEVEVFGLGLAGRGWGCAVAVAVAVAVGCCSTRMIVDILCVCLVFSGARSADLGVISN